MIPSPIFDFFAGCDHNGGGDIRKAKATYHRNRPGADAALSDAATGWGRSLAGLPPLAPAPA